MALPSFAQAAIVAAAAPARPTTSVRSSLFTQSRPSVFQTVEISEFAGLKLTSGCITYGRHVRENSLSLFHAPASQVIPRTGNTGYIRGETGKKLRVGINGFGRIGRDFLRCWHGRKNSPFEVVAVNDITAVENAAHLLKYDSFNCKFEADVTGVFNRENLYFMKVGANKISVISENDPTKIRWNDFNIDLVIEATGKFVEKSKAQGHIDAGAKKVIITAPPMVKEDDIPMIDIPMFVWGINQTDYSHKSHDIISNGSSTTNCVALLLNILHEKFGVIEKGTINATLSYANDQSLLGSLSCDKRKSRAAAQNIVPVNTNISQTLSLALPKLELKDKLNAIAMRVPTPNVSVVDLAVTVGKKITVHEVNEEFKRKAADGALNGILEVSNDQLVSMDFRGYNASAIVDTTLTSVVGENTIRVVAWYDNEWAYSQRLVDLAGWVCTKMDPNTDNSKTSDGHSDEQKVAEADCTKCKDYDI